MANFNRLQLVVIAKSNKALYTMCLILFVYGDVYSKDVDTCRVKFYKKSLDYRYSNHIKYKYIDSASIIHTYLTENQWLYHSININTPLIRDDYQATIMKLLLSDSLFSYKKFGVLFFEYEVRDNAFTKKWTKKGSKEFTKFFFENGFLKHKYTNLYTHFYDVIAVAFDLGILISPSEEKFRITYISECNLN